MRRISNYFPISETFILFSLIFSNCRNILNLKHTVPFRGILLPWRYPFQQINLQNTRLVMLHALFRHEFLLKELLTASKPSSCQDRNNFFLKKICKTMNYRITHKNGTKKELLFSQKPFHINYLLFYYFLKNLPIQQIILFSYTFKNQFLGSHIKFYRLYSPIRIIT